MSSSVESSSSSRGASSLYPPRAPPPPRDGRAGAVAGAILASAALAAAPRRAFARGRDRSPPRPPPRASPPPRSSRVTAAASLSDDDGATIVAVATPVVPQAGGVAIVRLSGPDAVRATRAVFAPASRAVRDAPALASHVAVYGTCVDPALPRDHPDALLDEVLVLPMLAPRSYTREDVVEIHCHGGSVCVQRVIDALLSLAEDAPMAREDEDGGADDGRASAARAAASASERTNGTKTHPHPRASSSSAAAPRCHLRLARPGEFTLRAFLNGRLDLTQAEAVNALVSARTARGASSSLAALRGGLASTVRATRTKLVDLLAELDARLDFDDELDPLDEADVARRIDALAEDVREVLRTARMGALMDAGATVAIVGVPNAGKSSLLNAWSASERAIVADVAGTTRDVVEAAATVAGVPVKLLDTAGIRDGEGVDEVERMGVERSRAAARGADAAVMVVDARTGWGEEDQRVWEETIRGFEKNAEDENDSDSEREGWEGGFEGEGADEFENARRRLYRVRGGLLDEGGARLGGARLGVGGDSLDGDNNARVATEASSILVMNKTDEMAPGDFFERDDDRGSDAIEIDPGAASETSSSSNSDSHLTIRASLATIPDVVRRSFAAVVVASAKTGAGLDAIESALAAAFGAGGMDAEGAAWAANRRQADALRVAEAALVRAREDAVLGGLPVDFWTIELREAANALGAVTGEEVGEDVLDVIFTKFCIGK